MNKKTLFKVIMIATGSIIIISVVFILVIQFTNVKKESKSALVDSQLSFCQELIVGKYKYSDVIAIKKSAGLAKSYSIVKYTGLIRTGIGDISNITYDVSKNGREILIRLPCARLLGNEIISQEIFDEKQSIFVRITTQEIFQEIQEAKGVVEETLVTSGLLEESWDHAAEVVKRFMYGMGFENVIIKIK